MFFSQRDSDNLESIARSLEKLAEREQERKLAESKQSSFLNRMKEKINEKPIKVSESSNLEDEALEEEIKTTQRMQSKLAQAHKDGNSPFFAEALLEEDELESLQ